MNELPVSVVIPTHNRAHYLMQALDSVFAQTSPASEILVIDDGSNDDTRPRLDRLVRAEKIRYFYQSQRGVSAARNKGIELATFPLIAFLDSDDLFLPTKLEKQSQVFRDQPDLGFVHCGFSKFNDQGEDLGIRDTSRFTGNIYPSILQEWSVLMAMPCMLVRNEVLREVGGFDEKMVWAEDMDLWRRISRRYAIRVVPEVLVKVRVHASSTTFERAGGVSGFERYIDKAFEEDKSLSLMFKRRVKSKMYSKLGQNLLGNGNSRQMKLVRQYQAKAICNWPLGFGAIFTWLASFLPLNVRNVMASIARQYRYPAEKIEKL